MDMPEGGQIGTLFHRMVCPALRAFNQQHTPDCVKEVMETTGGAVSSRTRGSLTRALFPCPIPPVRDAALFGTLHWYAQPAQGAAVASVCTDGSLLHGMWGRDIAAVGWAFVAFDVQGAIVAAAYGVPPLWVDTIQGAELWAVQMVLASMTLPEKIYTDCKTVQMGVNASAAWAGSSKRRRLCCM